jgi:hypothetical protein
MNEQIDINKMFAYLEQAESLIDSVYHYAMETGNSELRELMNVAGIACNDGRNMLPEPGMSKEEMMEKLEIAQGLLSSVYHDACEKGNSEIESNMSVADSCIIDVMRNILEK